VIGHGIDTDELDRPSQDGGFEIFIICQVGSLDDLGSVYD
jgi:hypothetical protein